MRSSCEQLLFLSNKKSESAHCSRATPAFRAEFVDFGHQFVDQPLLFFGVCGSISLATGSSIGTDASASYAGSSRFASAGMACNVESCASASIAARVRCDPLGTEMMRTSLIAASRHWRSDYRAEASRAGRHTPSGGARLSNGNTRSTHLHLGRHSRAKWHLQASLPSDRGDFVLMSLDTTSTRAVSKIFLSAMARSRFAEPWQLQRLRQRAIDIWHTTRPSCCVPALMVGHEREKISAVRLLPLPRRQIPGTGCRSRVNCDPADRRGTKAHRRFGS